MAKMYEECLNESVAAKKITRSTADKLLKHVNDYLKEAETKGMGAMDGYAYASSKAAGRMMEEVGTTKMDAAREIVRLQQLTEDAPKNSAGIYRGLQTILGERVRGAGGQSSLVKSQNEMKKFLGSFLTDFIEDLRSTISA
jgi:hypothetical protein